MTGAEEFADTFSRVFVTPDRNYRNCDKLHDSICSALLRPFLEKFEQNCMRPFFPTYSCRRLLAEEISNTTLVAAFVHYFNKATLRDEEYFMARTLLNSAARTDSSIAQDYLYIVFSYAPSNAVCYYEFDRYTRGGVKTSAQRFLREKALSEYDEQFLSICFDDYCKQKYTVNECRRDQRNYPCVYSPYRSPRCVFDPVLLNVERVDGEQPPLSFLQPFQEKPDSQGIEYVCEYQPTTFNTTVVGVDLVVFNCKDADAFERLLPPIPAYEAELLGPPGAPKQAVFRSDSNTDRFLLEMRGKETKIALLKRANRLFFTLRLLFEEKLIVDLIITATLLLENRYSAVLLYENAPICFRETIIQRGFLVLPLMMPFDKSGFISAQNLCLRRKENDADCTVFMALFAAQRAKKSVELERDGSLFRCFSNFVSIEHRIKHRRAATTSSQMTDEMDLAINFPTNCVLMRSNTVNNGSVVSVVVRIIQGEFLKCKAEECLVKTGSDGYQWYSFSFEKLCDNKEAVTSRIMSNEYVDGPIACDRLDRITFCVEWTRAMAYREIKFYAREYNVVGMNKEKDSLGKLYLP